MLNIVYAEVAMVSMHGVEIHGALREQIIRAYQTINMHPVVYMGALVTLVWLASWNLWETDRFAFLDRVMLAAAGGMLLWVVALAGGHRPLLPSAEPFVASDAAAGPAAAAPDAADDDDGVGGLPMNGEPKLFASVFAQNVPTDGRWGSFNVGQGVIHVQNVHVQGVDLKSRLVTGPNADTVQLRVANTYTWVMVVRFNNGSNGGSLVNMPTSTTGHDYLFDLQIQHSAAIQSTKQFETQFSIVVSKKDDAAPATAAATAAATAPATAPTRNVTIRSTNKVTSNPEKVYMIVLKRSGGTIEVGLYDLIPKMNGSMEAKQDVLKVEGVREDLVAANIPVKINGNQDQNQSLDANVYAIAMYNYRLDLNHEVLLRNHWSGLLAESSDPAERRRGECPYGPAVCGNSYCASITDWSLPEQLIDSRAECKEAIKTFCEANPSASSCYCWNKADPRYNKTDCKKWRTFMGGNDCKQLDTLCREDLEKVKQQYNLEDKKCAGEKTSTPESTGVVNPYNVAPPPAVPPAEKTSKTDDDDDAKIVNPYANPLAPKKTSAPAVNNPYAAPLAQTAAPAVNNPYAAPLAQTAAPAVNNPYAAPLAQTAAPAVNNPYANPLAQTGAAANPLAQTGAAANPLAQTGAANASRVVNPYTAKPIAREKKSKLHDPYLRKAGSSRPDRLAPLEHLKFHDKWGGSKPPEEPAPKKTFWQGVRDALAGD